MAAGNDPFLKYYLTRSQSAPSDMDHESNLLRVSSAVRPMKAGHFDCMFPGVLYFHRTLPSKLQPLCLLGSPPVPQQALMGDYYSCRSPFGPLQILTFARSRKLEQANDGAIGERASTCWFRGQSDMATGCPLAQVYDP